jgi:hypothetical protein
MDAEISRRIGTDRQSLPTPPILCGPLRPEFIPMSIGTVNTLRPQPPLPSPIPRLSPINGTPDGKLTAQRSRASFRLTAGPQTARDH